MILCIGPTPAVQRVMVFQQVRLDAVNRARTTLDGAAGKGVNVAKVLKALAEQPLATGFLGGDRGQFLLGVLRDLGIETDFVSVSARTRQCITVIDESAGTQTELVEESLPLAPKDYTDLMNRVRGQVERARAMICSGTITPGGPPDFYCQCAGLARDAGALCLVDAQGQALLQALRARPGLVKPNLSELSATVNRALCDESDIKAAIRQLQEAGAERIVVTAGKRPSWAFDGKRFWRVHAPAVAAVNPIGSGDAFTAGLASRLLRGDDLGEACRWASAAGAANALTLMAGDVHAEDVQRLAPEVRVESI